MLNKKMLGKLEAVDVVLKENDVSSVDREDEKQNVMR